MRTITTFNHPSTLTELVSYIAGLLVIHFGVSRALARRLAVHHTTASLEAIRNLDL